MKQTCSVKLREVVFSLRAREQVLPDRFARAAVRQQKAIIDLVLRRQLVEQRAIGIVELLAVPDICGAGIGVEIAKIDLAKAGQIVIAAQHYVGVRLHRDDTFIRPWAIANRIANSTAADRTTRLRPARFRAQYS